MPRLGTNPPHLTRLDITESSQNCRNQRPQVDQTIRRCANDHDTEREHGQVLLKLEIAVHREQDIELTTCPGEQIAVRYARPPEPGYGMNLVAGKLERQFGW